MFAQKANGDIKYFGLCAKHTMTATPLGQNVFAPSEMDHHTTKPKLKRKIEIQKLNNFETYKRFEKIKSEAENYDNKFGTLWATSESSNVPNKFDWALIQPRIPKCDGFPTSKHVRPDILDNSAFNCESYVGSCHSFEDQGVDNATQHFATGPNFLPIRTFTPGDIALKPSSRSTREWTIGSVNDLDSSCLPANGDSCGVMCIIGKVLFSTEGDSGSIVLGTDYRPAAVFGGGVGDITLVHTIGNVFGNIEDELHLPSGSVTWA
ncbi:hypothetical protein IFR05_010663 [Cadophora sp. M221]|nr:hypothetical protein IFR05_010663 [Cadophora sp. M221]